MLLLLLIMVMVLVICGIVIYISTTKIGRRIPQRIVLLCGFLCLITSIGMVIGSILLLLEGIGPP